MAWDEVCLQQAQHLEAPILRFYSWAEACTTFGYSQRFADVQQLADSTVLIRRLTGGGIVPHLNDWTYSVAFPPNTDWYHYRAKESYRQLHGWLQRAFARLKLVTKLNPATIAEGPGRCFIGAEEDDVMLGDSKLAGAAQRRNKLGFMIQGSVQPPPKSITREKWEQAMLEVATADWGIEWQVWTEAEARREEVSELARTKYAAKQHTQKR